MMATWRRRPAGTIVALRSRHPAQVRAFGRHLQEAGLLGSMGKVACAYDNSMMESFFGSMQIELLDHRSWTTRAELATAIFDRIEAFYDPVRRHSALGYLSPTDYETFTAPHSKRHDHPTETVRETGTGHSVRRRLGGCR
jgi:putative transposase